MRGRGASARSTSSWRGLARRPRRGGLAARKEWPTTLEALLSTGPSSDRAESLPSALRSFVVGPPRLRARALKAGFPLGHAGTHLV